MILRENYIEEISNWIGKEKIIILKWARQVWKTTLMKYFFEKLKKEWEQVEFLSADRLLKDDIFETPDDLINFIKSKFVLSSEKKLYLFIDEFQYIKNAGLFLKNIFDEYKSEIQIICSGSSSLEITKNSEFLTWRAISFYIDRVWFKDYFFYKNSDIIKKTFDLEDFNNIENFYKIYKNNLENNFLEYLNYWWYPEWVITENKRQKERLISEIIKIYIEKDVASFLKIENIRAFNDLIKLLSSNIWELINVSEISNVLNISIETTNKYLDILEWTFIFTRVRPFFRNVRKELSKMPKIFIEDLAIKNYELWEFDWVYNKINIWSEVENFVYNELRKKIEKEKIYFYRTVSKSEIDFIIEEKYNLYSMIEVKYKSKVKIPLAFKNFWEKYEVFNKIIITKDLLKYENSIYYIPACIFPFLKKI